MPRAGELRRPAPSPWCEVRGSPVHGRGVFATVPIPAGTRIIEYGGELVTKREAERRGVAQFERSRTTGDASVYLFILDKRYDIDGNFPWNDARLINHSCRPNCETEILEDGHIWVVALRDIAAGEELFFDYHFDLADMEDHRCRCGAPGCIGYIVSSDHREEALRRLASAPPALLVATANRHKTGEFRALLGSRARVLDLHDFPGLPQAEESGTTFEENSALKAVAAARAAGRPALADDSGLEVDALGGAPGVLSARYAGPDADDRANRHRLLAELQAAGATTPDLRRARFRCVLTLARPDGSVAGRWSGSVEGRILPAEKGTGGFGYDALFEPEGFQSTFAEMPEAEKNRLSHRARAAAAFLADWPALAATL